MKLIIDIPEKMYHMINAGFYDYGDMNVIIQNGIPLPKGHGRLIDADAFIKQESCCGYIEDMDIDYFKQNTPTIIEADMERNEDDNN